MTRTWFITGAGRGLGNEFAKAALERGDNVAATARQLESLTDLTDIYGPRLLPIGLDVTHRDAVFASVSRTKDAFGSIDVVVNNAGYGLFGAVEELTPDELQGQLEVNLFGPLHVTQAVLPILREQGAGHIIQISTVGGVAAFPILGGYHASKWALEGLTESLAQEVAGFGIKVTLVQPAGYATDWGGASAKWAKPLPEYQAIKQTAFGHGGGLSNDPSAVGSAILAVADAAEPPLRVFFGRQGLQIVQPLYAQRIRTWQNNQDISMLAEGK
ncbi:short-chain dehydrogenase [Leifsonia sp. Root227]|uniref:SDR family NAD(P)-dependent oxidoreductase n=1 Tax=Leifsonia sp. Root227 TaxID=1736496 RepID=UPI0007017565|nr:SDR family NAD(P)-dependent oxidoreductase [Leifsonia sp. Root227]KRC51932.1 short-chain dehydrogenase [Leifsonia sp. Root227]